MKRAGAAAALLVVVGALCAAPIDSHAQAKEKLRNDFSGKGVCLDIVNDGRNNTLHMAKCENVTGQSWSRVSTSKSGYVNMKTDFTGDDRCLDIVNDGKNNKPTMAKCANVSGQFWSIEKLPDGKARLRNTFSGRDMCLDIVNDGKNRTPQMAKCGDYTGQMWSLTAAR
jgi:hypothetical protein